jgi:hypothetical protein
MTDNELEYDGVVANLNAMLDDLNAGFGMDTIEAAIDHINRQKIEIASLNYENLQMIASIKHLRAKAIKDFAERLKTHTRKMQSSDFSGEFWDKAVLVSDIDNLVKEMVGADDEQNQSNI